MTSTPTFPNDRTPQRASMRFVFAIVAGCVGFVGVFLVSVGLLLPNHWQVKREILVHAPPTAIHPLINDFKAWRTWAAEPGDDPTLQYSYEGAPSGVGAVRRYTGQYAGSGRTQIVRSDANTGVSFTSAVQSETNNAHSSIEFKPLGGSTSVVWTDEGEISSLFGVFLRANVEEELTKYMDASLARLKAEAERRASAEDNNKP